MWVWSPFQQQPGFLSRFHPVNLTCQIEKMWNLAFPSKPTCSIWALRLQLFMRPRYRSPPEWLHAMITKAWALDNMSATTAVMRAFTAASAGLVPNQSPMRPRKSGQSAGKATEINIGKIAKLHLERRIVTSSKTQTDEFSIGFNCDQGLNILETT